MNEILLGVNIDHIATLRSARGTKYPDPVHAAFIAEQAGANSITVHLRKDRRHIVERDIHILSQTLQTRLNLEICCDESMIDFACKIKPYSCCLVPENIQELTTEGGLNIVKNKKIIFKSVKKLQKSGINVSLFVDPNNIQIESAIESNASHIEINTDSYSKTFLSSKQNEEIQRIRDAVKFASNLGFIINAGHGLTYYNVLPIASIASITELNIGHSIVCRALIQGLTTAVQEMKLLIQKVYK